MVTLTKFVLILILFDVDGTSWSYRVRRYGWKCNGLLFALSSDLEKISWSYKHSMSTPILIEVYFQEDVFPCE